MVNLFILMILYDFCVLPVQFCYIIVYTRKAESRVQIADRCAPWKISSGAENLIFVGFAILRGRCLPVIPGGSNVSHYSSDQCLMEG
jgi:hypothetical protein